MRISDWSSDVCSSDLGAHPPGAAHQDQGQPRGQGAPRRGQDPARRRQAGPGETEEGLMYAFTIEAADKPDMYRQLIDRKSVVSGKSVSVSVDRGGRRNIKKKKYKQGA